MLFLLSLGLASSAAVQVGEIAFSEPYTADSVSETITALCGTLPTTIKFENRRLKGGKILSVTVGSRSERASASQLNRLLDQRFIERIEFMSCRPNRTGLATKWMMAVRDKGAIQSPNAPTQIFITLGPGRVTVQQ